MNEVVDEASLRVWYTPEDEKKWYLHLLKKQNTDIYKANFCCGNEFRYFDTIKRINNEIFFQRVPRYRVMPELTGSVTHKAWFENGDMVDFSTFGLGTKFNYAILRHFVSGVEEFRENFTNDQIIDMQQNAPDHPLIKAMNKVIEAFADKGSGEMKGEKPAPQKQ